MHNTPHSIYLTRHGQSEYNRVGKIGGDSPLTDAGNRYARKLAQFAEEHIAKNDKGERIKARLWTSSLQRTIQTARFIAHPKLVKDGQEWVQMSPRVLRNLDELYAGVCDGMAYAEIEEMYPEEFKMRKEDKLGYRWVRRAGVPLGCTRGLPALARCCPLRKPRTSPGTRAGSPTWTSSRAWTRWCTSWRATASRC